MTAIIDFEGPCKLMGMQMKTYWLLLTAVVLCTSTLPAADWARFRGENGSASSEDATIPIQWSETENLAWKTKLPGRGSSSAIVVGKRVYITCFSGYGEGGEELNELKRHLICIDRTNGKIIWDTKVAGADKEDTYRGFLKEHGYASSTPVCDGKRIYTFFGKAGVFAFDLDGKQLWQADVGKESNGKRWGSAASPVLVGDLVIVNASDESESLRGLNRETGKEVWKAQAAGLALSFGTPVLAKVSDDRTDLVLGVPSEIWGLDPTTGKLLWFTNTKLTGNVSPSAVVDGDTVYLIGGYLSKGSIAIRAGGKGKLPADQRLWESRYTSYVPSPVLYKDHLYWVDDRGLAHCLNAKSGELVYRERLEGASGGGFVSRPFYGSIVRAGKHLIVTSRTAGTFVIAAKPEFEQIAQNKFPSDKSDFNSSPAISEGQLLIRSNEYLYCIQSK